MELVLVVRLLSQSPALLKFIICAHSVADLTQVYLLCITMTLTLPQMQYVYILSGGESC